MMILKHKILYLSIIITMVPLDDDNVSRKPTSSVTCHETLIGFLSIFCSLKLTEGYRVKRVVLSRWHTRRKEITDSKLSVLEARPLVPPLWNIWCSIRFYFGSHFYFLFQLMTRRHVNIDFKVLSLADVTTILSSHCDPVSVEFAANELFLEPLTGLLLLRFP